MHLNRNETVAGYPAKTIRHLLRKYGEAESGASAKFAAHLLKINEVAAGRLLKQLAKEGYLEPCKEHTDETLWRITIKGNALASATFLKPISRQKATEILHRFLDRVAAVNQNSYFLVGVKQVEGFGSYLSDATHVNDIDLIVHYAWKGNYSDHDRRRLRKERVEAAQRNGRKFTSFIEKLFWPEREVKLYIRDREPRLSLHASSEELEELVQPKLLYQGPDGIFEKNGE